MKTVEDLQFELSCTLDFRRYPQTADTWTSDDFEVSCLEAGALVENVVRHRLRHWMDQFEMTSMNAWN